MSEATYLVVALAVVVAYLLLTGGDGPRVRPRIEEIGQIGRALGRELDRVGERARRMIDEAERNVPSRRR